ncbi:hypothetical protein MaMV-DH010187 [Cyanophage MaMV-DH01]|nr:hypothetical protein MaMV-DH010187 [Cyanophage MaMV-DH01]
MNQTQLDKKIDQFLRKKLTKAELKEMGIKPRSLILTIRNIIERYLPIIWTNLKEDVPYGWEQFFECFRLWQELISEKDCTNSCKGMFFWFLSDKQWYLGNE